MNFTKIGIIEKINLEYFQKNNIDKNRNSVNIYICKQGFKYEKGFI